MSQHLVVKKAVDEAIKTARHNFPEHETKLISKEGQLRKTAEDVAREQVTKKSTFDFVHASHSDKDLTKFVSEHLAEYIPKEQLRKIETGLHTTSYRVNFRFERGHYYADITKSAEKYMDSVKLNTDESFETVLALQLASIFVEAVGLMLSIVGISISEENMAEAAAKVAEEMTDSSIVQKALEELKQAFQSSGSFQAKAKAIWELLKALWELKDSNNGHFFVHAIKLLLPDVSISDILVAVVKIGSLIAASIATHGAALLAKIVSALVSAYEFGKKIKNLFELDTIKTAVKKDTDTT